MGSNVNPQTPTLSHQQQPHNACIQGTADSRPSPDSSTVGFLEPFISTVTSSNPRKAIRRVCRVCGCRTLIDEEVLFRLRFYCSNCCSHTELNKSYQLQISVSLPNGGLASTVMYDDTAEDLLGVTAYRYDQIACIHPTIHTFVEQLLCATLVMIQWRPDKRHHQANSQRLLFGSESVGYATNGSLLAGPHTDLADEV
ncbi:hypothetical protein BASA83_010426 [Batrachochytrium salamandrivorans]|nr:hypothetical protein BASA83_010426 [Batrachochytrium salamandrivorans]